MNKIFRGMYSDEKRGLIRSPAVSLALLLIAFVVSHILGVFNSGLWHLDVPLFAISLTMLSLLSLWPMVSALRRWLRGWLVAEVKGFSSGGVTYQWSDVQGIYTKYVHVVEHRYLQARTVYNGSVNRLYECVLIRSPVKDLEVGYLKDRFRGTRSSPDQNELPPFPTETFVELRVSEPPHLLVMRQDQFEELVDLLRRKTQHELQPMLA